MRALVTNADGVQNERLDLLAGAARDRGLSSTVVGPMWDTSGCSAALTAVSHSGRVWVHHATEEKPTLAMEATPAFIVRSAFYGAFGPSPDVVLSGINDGTNTGYAALHSGTVGAALTGTARGCRALAISADFDTPEETSAYVARRAVGWLLALKRPCVLNVNIPNRPLEEIHGAVATTLEPGGSVQATVTESGDDFQPVVLKDSPEGADPQGDEQTVGRGFVSVTALRPLAEEPLVDLEEVLQE